MKTTNYEQYTKAEVIKLLDLSEKLLDCFGERYEKGVEVYEGDRETENAYYYYTLDNRMSQDLDDGKTFFLTIERKSKNKFVWSTVFQRYIPRKTTRIFELKKAV